MLVRHRLELHAELSMVSDIFVQLKVLSNFISVFFVHFVCISFRLVDENAEHLHHFHFNDSKILH